MKMGKLFIVKKLEAILLSMNDSLYFQYHTIIFFAIFV